MIEGRRHPRIALEFQVLRQVGDRFVKERGLDLSAGGFALETDDTLKPGSEWAAVLSAPDGSHEVAVRAKVAHLRSCRSPRASFEAGFELLRLEAAISTGYEELLRALFFSADGRRGARRLRVDTPAIWLPDGGAPEPATLVDLSLSGARIHWRSGQPAGEEGTLSLISVANGEMRPLRARVVRRSGEAEDQECGLSFADPAEQRPFLSRVIDSHLLSSAPWRPAPPRPAPARFRVGEYEVHAIIAFGGMAEVFRGHRLSAGAPGGVAAGEVVALKRLRRELASSAPAVRLFENEAELGARLVHRALVKTHELLAFGKERWLVMGYVDARDLSRLLAAIARQKQPADLRAVLGVALEVLSALCACHDAGVIHGDVTTSNVLVGARGVVKLVDLGVATCADSSPGEAGLFSGKLPYLAPELVDGEAPSAQADVYQTGILLYEALTGVRPFGGNTPQEVRAAIKRGPVPPSRLRPELPMQVEKVLLAAINPHPKKRPRGARALMQALHETGSAPSPEELPAMCEVLLAQAAGRSILDALPPPFAAAHARKPPPPPFDVEVAELDELDVELVEVEGELLPPPPPFEVEPE